MQFETEQHAGETESVLKEVVAMTANEHRTKTYELFHAIEGMGAKDIEDMVAEYIRCKLKENDYDVIIKDVILYGSRSQGLESKDSDIDILVEYMGDKREDDMFNLLHEDGLTIGGIVVDINPITAGRSGTIEMYLGERVI